LVDLLPVGLALEGGAQGGSAGGVDEAVEAGADPAEGDHAAFAVVLAGVFEFDDEVGENFDGRLCKVLP
jgi:hypothetical protein